jgi:hypothetical protein
MPSHFNRVLAGSVLTPSQQGLADPTDACAAPGAVFSVALGARRLRKAFYVDGAAGDAAMFGGTVAGWTGALEYRHSVRSAF